MCGQVWAKSKDWCRLSNVPTVERYLASQLHFIINSAASAHSNVLYGRGANCVYIMYKQAGASNRWFCAKREELMHTDSRFPRLSCQFPDNDCTFRQKSHLRSRPFPCIVLHRGQKCARAHFTVWSSHCYAERFLQAGIGLADHRFWDNLATHTF